MQSTLLGIAIIGLSIVFALAIVSVMHRYNHGRVREGHNDVLVPLFLTAGTLYAVLLGFLVIAVWENYGEANANQAEEASTLTTLYRQTNGMPSAQRDAFRTTLREYTEDVVHSEWAIQSKTGGGSTTARRKLADLYRAFTTMPPAIANSSIMVEFLGTTRQLASDRNRRTLQAGERLPVVLWVELLFGGSLVVFMGSLLYMEVRWMQLVGTALLAGLVGTLLFVTLLLNTAYQGPLAIQPDAFEHSIVVFDSVDKGS